MSDQVTNSLTDRPND